MMLAALGAQGNGAENQAAHAIAAESMAAGGCGFSTGRPWVDPGLPPA